MEESQTQKLEIEKDIKEKLRIYFLISRPQDIKIQGEAIEAILAYNLDTAMGMIKNQKPDKNIVYLGQNVTVEDLLQKIYLEGGQILPPPQSFEEIPKEKMGLESFKAGLLLATNELVKSDEDKEKLKEIISRLEVKISN